MIGRQVNSILFKKANTLRQLSAPLVGLSRRFTVYTNQRFREFEIVGGKKYRYDASIHEYGDATKVYLQRRRMHKDEICKKLPIWSNLASFCFLGSF